MRRFRAVGGHGKATRGTGRARENSALHRPTRPVEGWLSRATRDRAHGRWVSDRDRRRAGSRAAVFSRRTARPQRSGDVHPVAGATRSLGRDGSGRCTLATEPARRCTVRRRRGTGGRPARVAFAQGGPREFARLAGSTVLIVPLTGPDPAGALAEGLRRVTVRGEDTGRHGLCHSYYHTVSRDHLRGGHSDG